MQGKTRIQTVTIAAAAFWLVGCNTVPSSNIREPLTARPQPQAAVAANSGSIFQPGRGVALFEDRRARYLGDTLTVNLVERTTATRSGQTTDSRSASADINVPVPTVLGRKIPVIGDTTWRPEGSNSHSFKDSDSNSNNISGSITVTVVEVLANGNLKVSGEKQVSVNNDTDYVRLAGVVNPLHITASNSVQSTQLADVQIESKNAQGMDTAQVASMMARFFLTLLPF